MQRVQHLVAVALADQEGAAMSMDPFDWFALGCFPFAFGLLFILGGIQHGLKPVCIGLVLWAIAGLLLSRIPSAARHARKRNEEAWKRELQSRFDNWGGP